MKKSKEDKPQTQTKKARKLNVNKEILEDLDPRASETPDIVVRS